MGIEIKPRKIAEENDILLYFWSLWYQCIWAPSNYPNLLKTTNIHGAKQYLSARVNPWRLQPHIF